jgi:hypothetical protein
LVAVAAGQRASSPKPQDKKALGEGEVKQLLLLMDTDKSGKISKKEYMDFMAAEFRPPGHRQERRVGPQRANPIAVSCESSLYESWQVAGEMRK